MKNRTSSLILVTLLLVLSSYEKGSLFNHPMPLLPNKTLDGKVIDENYFRGHVTIVSFMWIGCVPCMNEISVLNRINDEYAGKSKLQVLCVARQKRDQMLQFNSVDSSIFYKIRKAMQVDSIRYAIQPACDDGKSTMEKSVGDSSTHITIKSECSTIEDVYGINSYPVIFYVDKKGIIREIHSGGPGVKNDELFYNEVKKEIELLLAE